MPLKQASAGAVPAFDAYRASSPLYTKHRSRPEFGPHRRQRPVAAIQHPQTAVAIPENGVIGAGFLGARDIQDVFGLLQESLHRIPYRTESATGEPRIGKRSVLGAPKLY